MQIISIDGGGFLGLATASFLQSVEARFGATCTERFELFCGTSTGAIIALALASGKPAIEVVALYEQLGTRVFTRPSVWERRFPKLRMLRQTRRALYDNAPLREVLTRTFGDLTLGDLKARGKRVLITAFNVSTGTPTIFKTDHGLDLALHDRYFVRDVALASSAAPAYLPLVELVDPNTGVTERFCDGGMVTNSPALLGYAEALSHLRCLPSDVAILSLGTPRDDIAEHPSSLMPAQRPLARGFYGWGLGQQIITITMDGGSKVNHAALSRIAKATGVLYERVDMIAPLGVGLDVATKEATLTLRQLGTARARDNATVQCMEPFFTSHV